MSTKLVRGSKSFVLAASLEERFQIFFLSCTAPGVQLWFYLPIFMCTTYRRLLPGLSQSSWSPRRWEGIKGAWALPGRSRQRQWLTVAHLPSKWEGPEVATRATPAHSSRCPPSAHSASNQHVGTEATAVTPLSACHWTILLHFRGSPGFFREHSQLRCSSCRFSGSLLAGNTSPLSGSALQTPCSASSPRHTGRHVSAWSMQSCGTDHLYRSPSVLPATERCYTLLQTPEAPPFYSNGSPYPQWGSFLGCGNLLSCLGAQVPSIATFHFLSLVLPGYLRINLVLTGVWGSLLVFTRCSGRIVPLVDVFLIYLWGEMNSVSCSTILTPISVLAFWVKSLFRKFSVWSSSRTFLSVYIFPLIGPYFFVSLYALWFCCCWKVTL